MTGRENFIAALRRQACDHVPFYFQLCPAQKAEFEARTGAADYEAYYGFDLRTLTLPDTAHPNDYSRYFGPLKPGTVIDEWGVGYEPGSIAHFTKFLHPMEAFTSPEQVWEFPLPDVLADYRWEPVAEAAAKCREEGVASMFFALQIFEPAWYLRGLDNLLCDMMCDPPMAEACLSRMAEHQIRAARRAAECGVDAIMFGDDVGTQRGLMMSADLWRQWLKGDMARAIAAAREVNPDVIAIYHSDGAIGELIPDLIGIGVDVLNPVQPECLDPAAVKAAYGDRLSLFGCVGTQTTMPYGSPAEVERTVRERIETAGHGGGLCLAPTHMLEPDVPYENLEAFVTAVKRWGRR